MTIAWKSFKVKEAEGDWQPGDHNIRWDDGNEYGSWSKVVREHQHGLTMLLRIKAPPGKAWRVVGRAPELGEEVYILGFASLRISSTRPMAVTPSSAGHAWLTVQRSKNATGTPENSFTVCSSALDTTRATDIVRSSIQASVIR